MVFFKKMRLKIYAKLRFGYFLKIKFGFGSLFFDYADQIIYLMLLVVSKESKKDLIKISFYGTIWQ